MNRSLYELQDLPESELARLSVKELVKAIKTAPRLKDIIEGLQNDLREYQNQQKVISGDLVELAAENARLKDGVQRLHGANMYLENGLHDLQQYSRRNNLERSGLQECKDSGEEEAKLLEFFHELGVTIEAGDIEACHRIPTKRKDKKKPLIVRFVNRRKRDKIFTARKQTTRRNLFVNEHLSPHNRWLYTLALEVKRKSRYRFLWTSNGVPCLRKNKSSPVVKVSCPGDLDGL